MRKLVLLAFVGIFFISGCNKKDTDNVVEKVINQTSDTRESRAKEENRPRTNSKAKAVCSMDLFSSNKHSQEGAKKCSDFAGQEICEEFFDKDLCVKP